METDSGIVLCLLIGGWLLSGCGLFPSDARVEKRLQSRHQVQIANIEPSSGSVSTDPAIAVAFTNFIEDDSFESYNFMTLRSGGIVRYGRATYVMTERTVYWQPFSSLPSGIYFNLQFSDSLTDLQETAVDLPRTELSSRTESEASRKVDVPTADRSAKWPDVARIFENECGDCHAKSARLPALEHATLVGGRSNQTDRFLVKPYDPADSYLMHKLLPQYRDRRHARQPPPFSSDSEPLNRDQLLTIEAWIARGAAGPSSESLGDGKRLE